MKETGVIRRIDELGRIVIPKEIRRRLKIEFQDEIDIFTNNDEIILRKYHKTSDSIKQISMLVNAFKKESKLEVVIFDSEKVIVSTDEMYNSGDYINKQFLMTIKKQDTYEVSSMHDFMITNFKNEKKCYCKTIFLQQKFMGFIMAISNDIISNSDLEKINMISHFVNELLNDEI